MDSDAHDLVAVMGATGAGKSTLVQLLTEDANVRIGHGLRSETNEIKEYSLSMSGRTIRLVDTPGFDDTERPDTEVFQALVDWLVATHSQGTKLTGILYLHRITDVRMQGSSVRNLRVFRDLCGDEAYQNVVLLPTFWKSAGEDESVLRSRLQELKSEDMFWGNMIKRGSRVMQEPLTRADALAIIAQIITSEPRTLQIQKEMIDAKCSLQNTSAASTFLAVELERQNAKHDAEMTMQRQEMENSFRTRERTHSDNLASLRRFHQQQLDVLAASNKELRDRIEQTLKDSRPPPLPSRVSQTSMPPVEPTMRRAHTASSESMSFREQRKRQRSQRFLEFCQAKTNTLHQIQNGRQVGMVDCNFFEPYGKYCYMTVCNNCLRTIGGDTYFRCQACSIQHDFVLCSQCFANPAVSCDSDFHPKHHMSRECANTSGSSCPRILSPPQNGLFPCKKCKGNIGRVYAHCCYCLESFDICSNCLLQRKHCPGHGRKVRSAHVLELCARYIDL